MISEAEESTQNLQQSIADFEFISQALKTARELKKDLTIFQAKIDAVNNGIDALYHSNIA